MTHILDGTRLSFSAGEDGVGISFRCEGRQGTAATETKVTRRASVTLVPDAAGPCLSVPGSCLINKTRFDNVSDAHRFPTPPPSKPALCILYALFIRRKFDVNITIETPYFSSPSDPLLKQSNIIIMLFFFFSLTFCNEKVKKSH